MFKITRKGYKFSEEHKKKIGLANTGKVRAIDVKNRISNTLKQKFANGEIVHPWKGKKILKNTGKRNPNYGKTHSKEIREKMSKKVKAAYQNNPYCHGNYTMAQKGFVSKPQKKLYSIIQNIYGKGFVFMDHPVKTVDAMRYVDVAVPMFKLGFEYNGAYWHQDKEKDRLRIESIENEGWNVVEIDGELR